MGNPVLATEKDAAQVGRLHPLPGLEPGLEHRRVVGRRDPGVVEQHVDPPKLLARARVHVDHLLLVGDVDLERQLAGRAGQHVGADDRGALASEQLSGNCADAAACAGDHANLALEPHDVE